MIKQQILAVVTLISVALTPASQAVGELLSPIPAVQEEVLAEHFLDLSTRAKAEFVNEVFKYNILHALEYFADSFTPHQDPGAGFTLEPGEVFAFHENVASEFADLPVKTGWTKYTAAEGYKTVGGLPGNGVCHLASLMNWVASEAGLEVVARVNHSFAPVPGIPREYGTSIRYYPRGDNSQNQNLYIKNNFDFPVKFVFSVDDEEIRLVITK